MKWVAVRFPALKSSLLDGKLAMWPHASCFPQNKIILNPFLLEISGLQVTVFLQIKSIDYSLIIPLLVNSFMILS